MLFFFLSFDILLVFVNQCQYYSHLFPKTQSREIRIFFRKSFFSKICSISLCLKNKCQIWCWNAHKVIYAFKESRTGVREYGFCAKPEAKECVGLCMLQFFIPIVYHRFSNIFPYKKRKKTQKVEQWQCIAMRLNCCHCFYVYLIKR